MADLAESGDPARMPVLAARGVHKTYANGTHALADVSLSVHAGEFVSLRAATGGLSLRGQGAVLVGATSLL